MFTHHGLFAAQAPEGGRHKADPNIIVSAAHAPKIRRHNADCRGSPAAQMGAAQCRCTMAARLPSMRQREEAPRTNRAARRRHIGMAHQLPFSPSSMGSPALARTVADRPLWLTSSPMSLSISLSLSLFISLSLYLSLSLSHQGLPSRPRPLLDSAVPARVEEVSASREGWWWSASRQAGRQMRVFSGAPTWCCWYTAGAAAGRLPTQQRHQHTAGALTQITRLQVPGAARVRTAGRRGTCACMLAAGALQLSAWARLAPATCWQ